MKLYRFSPIQSKDDLRQAFVYVAETITVLGTQAIGYPLPINSLTIFSHYRDEFTCLSEMLLASGEKVAENNGTFVELREPIQTMNSVVRRVRVRIPDPYRMQVGCGDFDVASYDEFKSEFLTNNTGGLREIIRPDMRMVEFFNPDFDVLAYVTDKIV
jgi:hypothetical protein